MRGKIKDAETGRGKQRPYNSFVALIAGIIS
jgi:hypothetical protein